ncbi:class I SAM-dependent DNA methyltransferase [Streptomyces sp. CA-250714]|uniref:class I SAM-dependent DNA methyltransferase n=1 Tax=Streptomyces sp. CA-250714 TaxID=3240060 RepID=UPI003D91E79D
MKCTGGRGRAVVEVVDPVRDTYDRMADFYDTATRADDYDRWVALYRKLIDRHGAPGRELVDLGCGTGKAALRLAAAGFTVTGIDLSPEMVRVAAAKPGAGQVRFLAGDLRELPRVGRFDVGVTLGEPLNYLADENELLAAFSGVARLLRPGGLFIFDVNTTGFYRRLAEITSVTEEEGVVTVQRGVPSPRQAEATDLHVDLFATVDGVTWRRTSTLHSFSYFSPPQVEGLLARAGLSQVADYGIDRGGLHSGGDEECDRKRLVVARKDSIARAL